MLQDLQLAPAHRVDDELRILVDHHRAQVQLTALEHVELLVDRLRRDLELEFGKRSEHVAREVLGATAEWPDAEPQASQVLRRLNAVGIAAEDHERLGPRQAPDQLEPLPGRPIDAILHQRELDVARGLAATSRWRFSTEPAEATFAMRPLRRDVSAASFSTVAK